MQLFPVPEIQVATPEYLFWVDGSHKTKFANRMLSRKEPKSVSKIRKGVGLYLLFPMERTLKAIKKILKIK